MHQFLRAISLSFIILLLYVQNLQAQFYQTDPSFQPLLVKQNQGFLHHLIVQPDQKILIGGGHNFIHGQSSSGFNRLNADGSLDTSFHPAHEIFNPFWLDLRKDNQIVVADLYADANDKKTVKIFLLHPNGKVDSTFQTDIETSAISSPRTFTVHIDNTIIIGTNPIDGNRYKTTISRINTDGSTVTLYKNNSSHNSWISSLQLQPDGKILAIGDFPLDDGSTKYFMRLNTDGSIDTSFNPYAFLFPRTVTLLPDGKMLVAQHGSILTRLNADGSTDPTFQTSPGSWNGINTIFLQPDGKILLSVWIEDKVNYFYGRSKIIRLNPDGTLDTQFDSGEGAADYRIELLALQTSGHVLLGGTFRKFNGKTNAALVRLKGNDGSLDTSFITKMESNGYLKPVIQQSDGKLLVGGSFDTANDQPMSHITRLNTDGKIDTTFNIGSGVDGFWDVNGGIINAIALQTDNRILAGGFFKSFNGKNASSLLRLHPDGSIDGSFSSEVNEHYMVNAILVQPDGKIVVSGDKQFNTQFKKFLFRLNADGSLDSGFQTGNEFDASVTKIVGQPDGKLLIAGYFTTVNGKAAGNITRVLPNGTIDTTFIATGASGSFFRPITSVVLQPDGKILVGGNFTSFNGTPFNKIVRLNTDGSIDSTFTSVVSADSEVSSIIIRPDGRLLIGGNFFNLGNRTLNTLTSTGTLEYSVFLFEELNIFSPDLLVSGNNLFLSGNSRLFRLIRKLTDQIITFEPIPDQHPDASPFTINPSTNSNLSITLTVVTGPATISGNTVTLKGEPGKVTIRASQAGNDFYNPAADVERSFMVDAILGVESELSQATTLFPNPTHGEFIIHFPASPHHVVVELLNSQGQPVRASFTPFTNGVLIKTHQVPVGMYIVRIKLGGEEISKKVVFE